MIRISNISMPLDYTSERLKLYIAKKLRIRTDGISQIGIVRKSVDARKKDNVHFVLTADAAVADEKKILERKIAGVSRAAEYLYELPGKYEGKTRPVVIGAGPAGLFAALILAESGAAPIVLERGRDVERRRRDVESFMKTGELDTESNIQFGEGGAGTFSDGKLNTGIKDPRRGKVMNEFVACGAPAEILTEAKPHVGTDMLSGAIKKLREKIISLGGEVRFESRFCGFTEKNGVLASVKYERGAEKLEVMTDTAVLAIGHSARDTFSMLFDSGVKMEQKDFAMGVRIEHRQCDIDRAMYGDFAGNPALRAADYKLAVHLPSGRDVYTFCMCPGGYVVPAASEDERLVTNGMSNRARDGENANSALLVGIRTSDFGGTHPLDGMRLQRKLEHAAFEAGGGGYKAPVSLVGDFLAGEKSTAIGSVTPTYSIGFTFASPDEYLPPYMCEALREGIRELGKKIRGFDSNDAVLTGVESRSSSPVRIKRGENLQSETLSGLYPCGEGAGYAGGIVSAAVDGMKCAERIITCSMEHK